jgi:hypothetical protein
LCVKKQAPKDDYGKEFQQKVQGSLCRNSIAVLSMSSGPANFAQRKSLSTRQVCQCKEWRQSREKMDIGRKEIAIRAGGNGYL